MPKARTKPPKHSAQRTPHPRIALLALAAVTAAALAAIALALQHLGAMDIPGCGDGSPCADLARSKWGTIPGIGLSTAALGAAYFTAMTAAWLVWGILRPSAGRPLLALTTLGGVASAAFLVAMLTEGKLCRYCLASHLANFVFVAAAWLSMRGAPVARAPFQQLTAAACLTIAFAAGALTVESSAQSRATQKHEAQLAESVKNLTAPQQPESEPTPVQTTPPKPEAEPQPATQPKADAPKPEQPAPSAREPLTGRFPSAPMPAPIRIVMFTDYQCPDCRILEQQLEHVKKTYPGVSASIRFYPFSTTCNSRVTENLHPDACFAASAALAVGTLGGTDAFWDIHAWLFERKGSFTAPLLTQKVTSMGLDANAIVAIVNAQSNFGEIGSDIALGNDLGLRYTPMIFINGVELKGFTAPNALIRAVDALAKTSPAPSTADNDRPPLAAERYIADWREAPTATMPERFSRRWLGDAAAPTSIVLVGDYMEPGTFEVDAELRALAAQPSARFRYNFIQFPMNQDCNPQISFTKFPKTCIAARAAEAAFRVGGTDGFWRMHEWLMNNRDILTEELLVNGAPAIQFDAAVLTEAMRGQPVADDLNEDALGVLSLGVTSLPTIYINNKPAVSWKAGNDSILPRLIEEAQKP
ncbi:MAG TPA: DsbA family protein [Phycisphaerales bacterium]|nr:DsbA family protein [Phycisphaerales bacterium]